jgi:hypothetical protein
MNSPVRNGLWLAPLAILCACAGRPEMQRFDEFAAKPEKALYAALRETQAGDDQSARILDVYDQHQLRLKTLQTKAAAIMDAWRSWTAAIPRLRNAPVSWPENGPPFAVNS